MDEYYQSAIDIVTSDNDWKSICIAIAKSNPKVLCDALNMQSWQLKALAINDAEGKVAAMKYLRKEKGIGLKEAKDLLESLSA